jgi:hypothetical protein
MCKQPGEVGQLDIRRFIRGNRFRVSILEPALNSKIMSSSILPEEIQG